MTVASTTVTVQKADAIINIPETDLRQGDLVLLQAGDLIPADLKLVEASGLEVDEWELTGELVPVEKKIGEEDVVLYRGSKVTRGHGQGVVIAVGEDTEYAAILKQPWEQIEREPPALIKTRYLSLLVLLLPPCIVALRQGAPLVLVCSLAALSAVVIVLLQNGELFKYALTSVAAHRLERQNIHVRDLAALDIIGDVNLACLDKTGVLTTREIAVRQIHFADEPPDQADPADRAWFPSADERAVPFGIACALCNDVVYYEKLDQANPVDQALIAFAAQHGYAIEEVAPQYRRIYDQPFDSEARYMAVGVERDNRRLFFAKGDPDVILKMCWNYLTAAGREQAIDASFRDFIKTRIDTITQAGNIVIALAYRPGTSTVPPGQFAFLGLIELENPLRPGVPEVVEKLKQVGVRTIMLTGDKPETAMGVSRQIGIDANLAYQLTGKQIDRMSFADVAWQAAYVSIFARLRPSQKGVLIRLFQRSNHRVAMVGDGANDTIALRAADVGISFVENSSPIARRVSKILINDLVDLLTLISSARYAKSWERILRLFRLAILIALFLSAYLAIAP